MNENSLQMLSTVAALYYLDGESQEYISAKLHISRSSISRMLKKAREKGIVEIKINFSTERNDYFESKLKETFGIESIVVNTDMIGTDAAREEIKKKLISEMDRLTQPGNIVGVTRGSIFYDIGSMLEKDHKTVSFAQVMGMEAAGAAHHYARDIVTKLSEMYGGKAYYLDVPLVLESREAREALKKVPTIARTFHALKRAALLMTTIPQITEGRQDHIWQHFISEEQYRELLDQKAVGAVFGRVFNIKGEFLDVDLNENIMGIELDTIKEIHTLAICYGNEFSQAALGCLRTGLINELITDSACARGILEHAGKEENICIKC